jgi:hypothetical protein
MPTLSASPRLPPAIFSAFAVAVSLERSWEEAAELTTPHRTEDYWARGACVETSIQLRDELADKLPEVEAVFIWGYFVRETRECLHFIRGPEGGPVRAWHAWVEIAGSVFLDMTAGQFFSGGALRFVFPGSKLAERYEIVERDPEWARTC